MKQVRLQHLALLLIILIASCATSSRIGYSTGPIVRPYGTSYLSAARIYPEIKRTLEMPDTVMKPDDYYESLLRQKLNFKPPVTIVAIFPSRRDYYPMWNFYSFFGEKEDSIKKVIVDFLAKKLPNDVVKNIRIASSMFYTSKITGIQELAARYMSDEALIVSFSLDIFRPSGCLGFWPQFYLDGLLTSEILMIDTRTGFILVDNTYRLAKRSDSNAPSFKERTEKLTSQIIDEWTDKIAKDLLDFYKSLPKE